MYKLIEKRKDRYGFYVWEKYFSYLVRSKKALLVVKNHQNEVLFTSEEMAINQYAIIEDQVIYTGPENNVTKIYNLNTKKEFVVDTYFYGLNKLPQYIKSSIYYHIFDFVPNNQFLYNLNTNQIIPLSIGEIKGSFGINNDTHIVTVKEGWIYSYSKIDFSLLWQKDIGEMTQYRWLFGTIERGNIRDIHEYKGDSVVVLTDIFIVRLNINTGDILYLQRLPRGLISISIIDNKAYGCYASCYMEVDLDNGEVINYIEMDKLEYQGEKYDAEMGLNRLYAGYLYHGMRLEGGVFAIGAINIETGIREWANVLGAHSVLEIQFHQNRMYIADSGRNLYIYEKSNTTL